MSATRGAVGHGQLMSGTDVPSAETFHAFIEAALQGREIATRSDADEAATAPSRPPTEIELWNAAVASRKAARKAGTA